MKLPEEVITLSNKMLLKGPVGAFKKTMRFVNLSDIIVVGFNNESIAVWQKYSDTKYQYVGGIMILTKEDIQLIPIALDHDLYNCKN